MFKLVRSLDRISKTLSVQFVCAAGTNLTLKAEVEKLQNKLVKVLPEQEDLASLMPQFDAVLIKAGGMTCVESLAAAVPFAIWYRWRGQEAINTNVLTQNDLTAYVGDSEGKISRWLITALDLQTTR